MAFTTPRTWVAGEVVSAALGNVHWRDNLIALYAGAMAITTQANGRFVVASTATQLSVNKNAFAKNFMEAMTLWLLVISQS